MSDEKIEFHALANIFPLLEGVSFRELVEDIRINGLREPIVLLDGKILDGRNRYRAAMAAQVGVRFRQYDGKDALAFVISANLHRRHLDASQRAMIAAEVRRIVESNTRGRKPGPLAANRYSSGHAMKPLKNPDSKWAENRAKNVERDRQVSEQRVAAANCRVSADDAGALLNVSSMSVLSASIVLENGAPELISAVRAGAAAVSSAAEVAKLPLEQQRKILASKGVEAVAVIGRQAKEARLGERRARRAAVAASDVAVFDHIKIGDGRSIGNVRIGECKTLATQLGIIADVLDAVAGHAANADDKRIRDVLSERALSEYFRSARGELCEPKRNNQPQGGILPRHAAFAQAIADGLDPLAACQRAGFPNPNRMTGWRLLRNDLVRAEIDRIQGAAASITGDQVA